MGKERARGDACHAPTHDKCTWKTITIGAAMSLELPEDGRMRRPQDRSPDPWRTVSGWLWSAYLIAVASALAWWLL
jgi:hypothetical protein